MSSAEARRHVPLTDKRRVSCPPQQRPTLFNGFLRQQDVDLAVLRDQMGHADLRTTSIYVASERRALVAQMSKLRRRR